MSEHGILLKTYSDLLERSSRIIDEEISQLEDAAEPTAHLSEEKRVLIKEMDVALEKLKALNTTSQGVPADLKAAFDSLQHQFMRVIKMDRELEKTYLAKQRESRRVDLGNSVDRAGAKRLYGL